MVQVISGSSPLKVDEDRFLNTPNFLVLSQAQPQADNPYPLSMVKIQTVAS